MKEIRLSPNITTHDMSYRVKQANKFLESGHQVKITLNFKGREKLHEDIGFKTILTFVEQCTSGTPASNIRKIDGYKKMIMVTLNPKKRGN